MKPLKAKTVEKPGRGPGTKGVFPRYVTRTNAKKVNWRVDVGKYVPGLDRGMVFLDFDEYGILIGVEVVK